VESLAAPTSRFRDWNGPYYGFEHVELATGHVFYGLNGHYRAWLEDRGVTPAQLAAWASGTLVSGEGQVAAWDWDLPEDLHSSVFVGERTVANLERLAGTGRPFLLWASFQDPHHPFAVPEPWNAPNAAVRAPDHEPGELDDKPEHFRAVREGRLEGGPFVGRYPMAGQHLGQDYREVTEAWATAAITRYQGMVSLVDREVGRILEALERLGLAGDTIVVFTSDHGELLGEHGLWLKGPLHYEDVLRLPFIVRWPAALAGGTVDDGLVSLVDLPATLLAAAGVAAPPEMDGGLDLLPQWTGERTVREEVLAEFVDDPAALNLTTLITADRKITLYEGGAYAGREDEVGELYDLERDPHERRNLWADPGRALERQALRARLLKAKPRHRRMARRLVYA
jgi:uncharacterized sulfatase